MSGLARAKDLNHSAEYSGNFHVRSGNDKGPQPFCGIFRRLPCQDLSHSVEYSGDFHVRSGNDKGPQPFCGIFRRLPCQVWQGQRTSAILRNIQETPMSGLAMTKDLSHSVEYSGDFHVRSGKGKGPQPFCGIFRRLPCQVWQGQKTSAILRNIQETPMSGLARTKDSIMIDGHHNGAKDVQARFALSFHRGCPRGITVGEVFCN
ncbi:hypothetical protein J6590_076527 [Homalodisca vitripennis]|nr:hypothetical protein J6590_076527 [Homalodisca vitripennis]